MSKVRPNIISLSLWGLLIAVIIDAYADSADYRLIAPWFVTGIISIAALIGLIGFLVSMPVVMRAANFRQPPEAAWQALADYKSFPTWRSHLRRVEELPSQSGHCCWCELFVNDKPMPVWVERLESVSPEKLVHHVRAALWPMSSSANPRLVFQGQWVYEISPTPSGCQVRITERSTIKNPFLKFFRRILLPEGTLRITAWLVDLGRKFGEETRVIE
jgi:hypothetical protein